MIPKPRVKNSKFDVRYSDEWTRKAKNARSKTNHRCCLCLKRFMYLEVHHAVYCNKSKKKIAGKERTGVHIFPLCKPCHAIAHSKENWIRDHENPIFRNRNTKEFYKKLVRNYKLIQESMKL